MTGQSERIAEIEERIVRFARQTAPPRWRRIDLRCAATVVASDVRLTMLTGEDATVPAEIVPDELSGLLADLRRAHYLTEQGTWFSMLAIVEPEAALFVYNDAFDPEWDPPAPVDAWRRDQIVMPRDGANMPDWLRDRMAGREPSVPAEWPAPDPLNPVEQAELLTGPFTVLVADHAPPFWERVSGHYQAAGGHLEFPPMAVRKADGTAESWTPPAAAAALLDRLRAGTHAFQGSTWSRVDVEVVYGDGAVQCRASFTADQEPRWDTEPSVEDVRRELERLPRRDVPEWMARRLGPAPRVAPPPPTRFEGAVRRARVFDQAGTDGGPPAVSRPPVPPDEADRVVRYLEDAPTVMAARSSAPDQLDPSRGERVPLTFHTDGTWVWSGAVGYYLREHGVPPEPDLVAHIRAHRFQPPAVGDDAMDAASAAAMGRTAPRGIRTEAEPERWLALLQNRLDALQVDRARYRIRGEDEGAWCLLQEKTGWTVFHLDDGERTRQVGFDDGEKAAAYLLGSLLMVAPQQTVQIATIQPLKGEPPLSLLHDRRITELPTGTEVDRYGGHGGNTAYAARTPFPQRSLPADWQEREYHVYRLLRPLQVLTGTAVPWFEQPGGGTAYVFERSIAYLLADGSLSEVHT